MSSPCCPEVGFSSDQEIVQTLKDPHHSSICTQDQSNTQILLPPLELHDPIAHGLEKYNYIASMLAQHKWSTFLTFSCISWSRECIHSTSAHSVAQHHRKSIERMICAFTHFRYVDACKFGVCLFSLLYLSHLLVRTTGLLTNQAFTNMGQPMC